MENSPYFDTAAIIRRYSDFFGKDNIILIDYDGAISSGKDIVYIFLCENLKVFCKELSKYYHRRTSESSSLELTHHRLLSEAPSEGISKKKQKKLDSILGLINHKDNEKPDIALIQLVYHFRTYLQARGRDFCKFNRETISTLVAEWKKAMENENVPQLPVLSSKLTLLKAYSRQYDQRFRTMYGSVLQYSNETANNLAREKLEVVTIDQFALYIRPQTVVTVDQTSNLTTTKKYYWQDFLEKEIYRLVNVPQLLCEMK
jgi:hypothetical protein